MSKLIIDVPIPSMGATVNEMTLIDLLCDVGAEVEKGEKIAELESDKSIFDFESPCDGKVVDVLCRAGDILEVGVPFLRIETGDESLSHLKTKDSGGERNQVVESKKTDLAAVPLREVVQEDTSPVREALETKASGDIRWTPRARRLAIDGGLDPRSISDIVGTGPSGRVSGEDVINYLDKVGSSDEAGASASSDAETVCVAGVGYALPRAIKTNEEIVKAFPGKTVEEMVKVTGIRQRYVVSEGESATSLATEATQKALGMAGMSVSDVDAVIVATLLPDQPVPGAASALAKNLGIGKALAFDLNAACSGWLYALEVGRTFIKGGTAKNVLVVTAEILSSITNPRDPNTAFLFGDGAGAAILTPEKGGHRLYRQQLSGDATYCDAIRRTSGGALNPIPQPGDDMDQFYLQMEGGVVFKRAVIAFADLIESAAKQHGLGMDDVSWVVPHQPNERILRAVAKRVGIPYDKFVVTVGKYGNTSAASVSMALGCAAKEEIFESGDKIIFCSVGAGFTFAGGLMTW